MANICNATEAAKILGVSTTTFWRMRVEGKVQALSNYRSPGFSVPALKAIVEGKGAQQ